MAESSQSDNSFAKVFIPGLVIGLLVGMAVGVFLPPLLLDRGPTLPQPVPGSTQLHGPSERDMPPPGAAPAEKKPEEKKPEDKKSEEPKPGDKPTQPGSGKTNP